MATPWPGSGTLDPMRAICLPLVLGLSGCVGVLRGAAPTATSSSAEFRSERSAQAAGQVGDDPVILSAVTLDEVEDPGPTRWRETGRDRVTVVFSVPIDPAGLSAEDFLIIAADERQVLPARAVLDPSHESDELRAVTLIGAFGDAGVSSVSVIGDLYDAEGRPLDGLSAPVEGLDTPARVVSWAAIEPAAERCQGAAAAVRLWWNRPVRLGVSVAPARLASIEGEDGRPIEVVGIDDVEQATDEADHVIDLCLARAQLPTAVATMTDAFVAATVEP